MSIPLSWSITFLAVAGLMLMLLSDRESGEKPDGEKLLRSAIRKLSF